MKRIIIALLHMTIVLLSFPISSIFILCSIESVSRRVCGLLCAPFLFIKYCDTHVFLLLVLFHPHSLFIICSSIHVIVLLILFIPLPFYLMFFYSCLRASGSVSIFSPSDLYSMSLSLFRLYCHPHLYMCFSVHVFPVILWLHLCVFHLSSDHTFMSSLLPCDLLLCSPIYSVTVLRAFLLFCNPLSFSSLYPCTHLSILLTLISFLTLLLIM